MVKAAVLAGFAALMIGSGLARRWPVNVDRDLGVELSFPPEWRAEKPWGFGVEAWEGAHRENDSMWTQCRVALERFDLAEFEVMRGYVAHRVPDPTWREDPPKLLREVLDYLCLTAESTVEVRLDGLPAIMIRGRRWSGQGAAVIARVNEGFVVLHLYTPTEHELRRVWPLFRRMVRLARVREPTRCHDPEWRPPDHM